jgi:two-component system, chemotaxis family, sensor kinase CheA
VSRDRYKYFRVEAREILDQLGQGALDLEKSAPAPELVARLLRLAHTLKGAARVVKEREIADRAHALEDVLAVCRDVSSPVPRDSVDRLLLLVDEIGSRVARLMSQPSGPDTPGSADQPDQPISAFRPAMDDLDALFSGVFETHVRLGALRPRLAQADRARHVAALVADQLSRPRESEGVDRGGPIPNDKTRGMAQDLHGMCDALERNLTSNIDQLDRELRLVREAAERLRLAPARALFTFLERAVRDVAQALGKRVTFETHGGDVRVDTFVLNVMQPALLQVVRNAVAHGIETGDAQRSAVGKPVDGCVTLRVSQRGRFVSFACTDDGRGIDLDAVRRIAQRKGLVLDEGRTIKPEELLRLLLKGGISTSGAVTDLSGRGIGLDVVREAAERLGGEATVRTEAGKGTTIEVVVPTSVALFPALLVEGSEGTVAIPLDAVGGTLRLTREAIVRTGQHESILFGGQAIPLASLPRAASSTPSSGGSRLHAFAAIVRGRTGVAAFTVDRVVGTAQVIMRPLPEFAPASGVVAGTTLDAVGDPLLVFDPDSLVARAHGPSTLTVEAMPARLSVLVVDDSLTTRMLERSILESAGYDVDVATSGDEALNKARTRQYALFLVDVEMPGMDGFTFIERIRVDPALQHVPSILVTSCNSPEDRQRGEDVGARAYIVKSEFDQGVLLDRIRTLVG